VPFLLPDPEVADAAPGFLWHSEVWGWYYSGREPVAKCDRIDMSTKQGPATHVIETGDHLPCLQRFDAGAVR
jgi:hypothetical protein